MMSVPLPLKFKIKYKSIFRKIKSDLQYCLELVLPLAMVLMCFRCWKSLSLTPNWDCTILWQILVEALTFCIVCY